MASNFILTLIFGFGLKEKGQLEFWYNCDS